MNSTSEYLECATASWLPFLGLWHSQGIQELPSDSWWFLGWFLLKTVILNSFQKDDSVPNGSLSSFAWHEPSHVIVPGDQGTSNWYAVHVAAPGIRYRDVAAMEFGSVAKRTHPQCSARIQNQKEFIDSNCSLGDISIPSSDFTDRFVWNSLQQKLWVHLCMGSETTFHAVFGILNGYFYILLI